MVRWFLGPFTAGQHLALEKHRNQPWKIYTVGSNGILGTWSSLRQAFELRLSRSSECCGFCVVLPQPLGRHKECGLAFRIYGCLSLLLGGGKIDKLLGDCPVEMAGDIPGLRVHFHNVFLL